MKKTRLLILCLISLALLPLSGCLRSLHPLYTEETLVFEPELLGKWSKPDSEEYWLFEQVGDEKEYEVTIKVDDEKASSVLSGHLVKVGENLYLDLYLEDPEFEVGVFVSFHLLPAHTFMRIKQIQPTLQMAMIDLGTADKILEKDPDAVKHELIDDGIVLTAGPEELQKFIYAHKDTKGFFDAYSDMKPVKAKPKKKADEKSKNSLKKEKALKKKKAGKQ